MSKYNSPALDKGLDIMEYLSRQDLDQSQTDIAQGVGKKPNEIYRMLVCLESRGYINKNQVSGKYRLSLKLFYMAHNHSSVRALKAAAQYPMKELASFSKQSCHLSILDQNEFLIIAFSPSPGPVVLSVKVGTRFSMFKSSSGEIILSQLSRENQLYYLNKISNFTDLVDKEKEDYLNYLIEIKNRGYQISESKNAKGVFDIGVPIYIPEIDFAGALIVTMLSVEIKELLTSERILDKMKETILKIKANLGITKAL